MRAFSFLLCAVGTLAATRTTSQAPFARLYAIGDSVRYHMTAVNAGHPDTVRYSADVTGRVVQDSTGLVVERLEWGALRMNGTAVALAASTPKVREVLSLSPAWVPRPDVRQTDPRLVGPVLDLLTFYVDLQLAGRMATLVHAGDHVFLPLSLGGSWADCVTLVRAEDAIDFDITLAAIDSAKHMATIVVKHVPPQKQVIALPAPWMREPVAGGLNNWLEVATLPGGRVAARVGKEAFDVRLDVSLTDGRLVSATLDNPVDVVDRECADASLASCGAPSHYRILRTISIVSQP